MKFQFSLEKTLLLILFVFGLIYLCLPSKKFPIQLIDSVQSLEDADSESPERKAYFTNYDRDQVIEYYQSQFVLKYFLPISGYRLNYPPEDAYSIIRDQTRSTFLEEIVNPLRESIYINGFKPKVAKDAISYKGVAYEEKITIRFVSSSLFTRVLIYILSFTTFIILYKNLFDSIKILKSEWVK